MAPDNHSRRYPPQPGRFPVGAVESGLGPLGTPGGTASPRPARSEAATRSPWPRSFYRLGGRAGSPRPGSPEAPKPQSPEAAVDRAAAQQRARGQRCPRGRCRRGGRAGQPADAARRWCPGASARAPPTAAVGSGLPVTPRSSHSRLTPSGLQRPDLKSLDQRAQTAARAFDRRCGRKQ